MARLLLFIITLCLWTDAHSWTTIVRPRTSSNQLQLVLRDRPEQVLLSAKKKGASGGGGGFGGSNSSNNAKNSIKPKSQWDRYTNAAALKNSRPVSVAVRKQGEATEWLPVGKVKVVGDDSNVAAAVARQRALLADHARRLFPLQVSSKDKLEWGYCQNDDDASYVVVDPKTDDDNSISEKDMGFEGTPDPASGFYCVYNEGRMVSDGGSTSNSPMRPSSKKLG